MENNYYGMLLAWLSVLPRNKAIKRRLTQNMERLDLLWRMKPEELALLKNTNIKFYEGVIDRSLREKAEIAYKTALKEQIGIITLFDEEYPELLRETEDAPSVLFYKGDIRRCRNCISVIGSRKATAYGLRAAQEISEILAERGVCIVSGMARGIDSRAHMGALEAGGTTCAVVGTGIDIVYPPENKKLMYDIIEKGAVISEYAPGTQPLAQNFPARNRIISGLSRGLVVVEAGKESGTLITVDFALEQGRDVFAVPGNIYSSKSTGTNNLIKDGAHIVICAEEILNEYEFFKTKKDELITLRKYIIESIESGVFDIEETISIMKCTVNEINTELTHMQLDGLIEKQINGEYSLKN